MNFLAPLALALGLLSIPVIALYMLRLRRREIPVSSNLLWQQILRDREANAPWQRLRRNLLLLLQLLILAALVLALSRPYTEVPTISAGRVALLIDASASMGATDVQPSRMDAAKNQALTLIDSLGGSDTMAVIKVSGAPEVLAAYTNDRASLRAAVDRIQTDTRAAEWNAALTLAAAGFAGADKFSVIILGDGGLPADLPAIPGEIRYVPVGTSGENLAVGALAIADDPGGGPQLYAKINNYGVGSADVILSIKLDDALFNAVQYTVPAGGSRDVIVSGLPATFRRAEVSLTRPAASTIPDYLPVDDTAYVVYNPASAGRALLMTPRNRFLEQIFASLPGWQVFKGDVNKPVPTDKYDLYIFDSYLPNALPNANMLIINPPAAVPTTLFTVTGQTDQPVRGGQVRKDDARTANLKFENVNIRVVKSLQTGGWAVPLATANGNENLALILAGEDAGRRIALIPFDLYDSDLPLQIAWPILVSNLTNWVRTPREIDLPNGAQTGQTVTIRPNALADTVRIRAPGGSTTTLKAGADSLLYAETAQPGFYTLEAYRGVDILQTEAFAVNLFSPLESRIAPAATVRVGSLTAPPAENREIGQREYWPWIALIGLLVLVIEWYVYQRGARLPSFRPARRFRVGRGRA